MKKAEYLSKIHDKCPYCERPFKEEKPSINKKIVRDMVDNYLNS